jgi:hypothetical protein
MNYLMFFSIQKLPVDFVQDIFTFNKAKLILTNDFGDASRQSIIQGFGNDFVTHIQKTYWSEFFISMALSTLGIKVIRPKLSLSISSFPLVKSSHMSQNPEKF